MKYNIEHNLAEFKQILTDIKLNDTNYDVRNGLVNRALELAKVLGFEFGKRLDKNEKNPELWPVLCITLPMDAPGILGQVSWHTPIDEVKDIHLIPEYPHDWDGHDTAEKYRRIDEFIEKWWLLDLA